MSAGDKALGFLKSVFTLQERVDRLGHEVVALSDRLTRLSESHIALRDRVSTIEGYLRGRSETAAAANSDVPRIEG